MDLEIYFKPTQKIDFSKNTIGSVIDFYNKDFPDWENSDIVFLSINENKGSSKIRNEDFDHFNIRKKLYNFNWEGSLNISDLGILESGAELKDTYAAIKDITFEVQKKGKLLIILGGSQDLTFPNYSGYEKLELPVNLTCIDNRFDVILNEESEISSDNFINHLLLHKSNLLFNFSILGCQQFYISSDDLRFFDDLFFDYIRLGELQGSIEKSEPILRNTDILSVDLSSLRNSEFNSSQRKHPNGFFGNEMCQMIKYAGISDKISSVGFYNLETGELNSVDNELVAQLVFFLIIGF